MMMGVECGQTLLSSSAGVSQAGRWSVPRTRQGSGLTQVGLEACWILLEPVFEGLQAEC